MDPTINDSNHSIGECQTLDIPLLANKSDDMTSSSFLLFRVPGNRRLVLLQPSLFLRKTALVVVASYALLPLLVYKSSLPGALYAALLVLIHVGVLFVYLYRVQFGALDVDRISLGGRVLGLVVTVWLLTVVSGWQDHDHLGILAAQMLVLCFVHTVVLMLLMVAVEIDSSSDDEDEENEAEDNKELV